LTEKPIEGIIEEERPAEASRPLSRTVESASAGGKSGIAPDAERAAEGAGSPETPRKASEAGVEGVRTSGTGAVVEKASAEAASAENASARRLASAQGIADVSSSGKEQSPALSAASFSLAMTDNVRPRRMLLHERTQDEIGAETSIRFRNAVATLRNGVQEMRSPNARESLMPFMSKDFEAAVKAEQILRSAVESELPTTDLVQNDKPEHSLFSAERLLFAGNAKYSQTIRGEESRLRSTASGGDASTFGDAEKLRRQGADTAETVAASSSQGMRNDSPSLFSREVVLQARGGAALEDGLQHVVRFLRTEGRPAASIIIDPPALGRMEIELVTTAKGIEASIKVGSEQIRQIVQDNITVLRNNLEQQGVHLGEFVVDLRDNSKGNSGRHFSSADGRRKGVRTAVAEEQLEAGNPFFRLDLEHGLLSLVA